MMERKCEKESRSSHFLFAHLPLKASVHQSSHHAVWIFEILTWILSQQIKTLIVTQS